MQENEWQTRLKRIDQQLDAIGWKEAADGSEPASGAYRKPEIETDSGPADYGLFIDQRLVAIVEAKKLGLAPQNVLSQAERYSKGAHGALMDPDPRREPSRRLMAGLDHEGPFRSHSHYIAALALLCRAPYVKRRVALALIGSAILRRGGPRDHSMTRVEMSWDRSGLVPPVDWLADRILATHLGHRYPWVSRSIG